MTALPDTLHGRLFLLAHNPLNDRLTSRSNLPLLLRAAQLADLLRLGLLRDEHGHPVAAGPVPAGLDPLLAEQLRQIAAGRPRSWHRWVQLRRPTVPLVRDGLAAQGVLRLEQHRLLGLIPLVRIEQRDPRARKALLATLDSALRDPLSRVDAADAALVALADAARLSLVLDHRRRREHRARIADLAALCGPVPAALKRAIRAKDAAAASG